MNKIVVSIIGIFALAILFLVFLVKNLRSEIKKQKEINKELEKYKNLNNEKKEYEKAKENFRDNSINSANATVEFLQKLSEKGKQRNK